MKPDSILTQVRKASHSLIIAFLLCASSVVPSLSWANLNVDCLNRNIQVALEDYKQPATRGLLEYSAILGQEFGAKFSKLKPNSVWIDLGSGAGTALMVAAKHFNIRTIGINTQNYWLEIQKMARARTIKLQTHTYRDQLFISMLGNIRQSSLDEMAKHLGIETPRWSWPATEFTGPDHIPSERVVATMRALLTHLKQEKEKLGTRFRYVAKSVEEGLKTTPKADLISDVYGAYYYSGNRLGLFKDIYNKLADDGVAVILLGHRGSYPQDIVLQGDQFIHLLPVYLSNTFPETFQVIPIPKEIPEVSLKNGSVIFNKDPAFPNGGRRGQIGTVLVIKKTASKPFPDTHLNFDPSGIIWNGNANSGFEYPTNAVYRIRQP